MTPAEIRTAASIVGKAAKDKTGREAKRLRRITRDLRAAARAVAATKSLNTSSEKDAG
jgi:hypothetical protein